MAAPIKVMTVFGTRPEIIRLSAVLDKLDRCAQHVTVHTGQSYDYGLSEVFFRDFGLRKPDHFLEVKSATVGAQIGRILTRGEAVIRQERPDALLVLGDTNSALVAIIAKRYQVPVFHMEAGNRCFDESVPEELNRRIVDHIADVNLCYTDHARRYLLREGLPPGRVFVTGSPMAEVLYKQRARINASDVLARLELKSDGYFVVSAHREENIESPARRDALLETLKRVHEAHGCPVIVSTHPRTARRVAKRTAELPAGIRFCEPFGFFDYVHLQQHAFCVLSDSGTIFEESSILGFPAIVLRDSSERPEALDTGACVQTGIDPDLVLAAVELAVAERDEDRDHRIPRDYRPTNVSSRVVRHICGQARIVKRKVWGGDNDIDLFGQG
jgi:UDP-N-acetylglucosamine 2-epimerase (non-hydrolysing)